MKILFFALLRERLGCAEIQLEHVEHTTVAGVVEQLKEHSKEWRAAFESQELLAAINQSFVDFNTTVKKGDELAFFPPVTGG